MALFSCNTYLLLPLHIKYMYYDSNVIPMYLHNHISIHSCWFNTQSWKGRHWLSPIKVHAATTRGRLRLQQQNLIFTRRWHLSKWLSTTCWGAFEVRLKRIVLCLPVCLKNYEISFAKGGIKFFWPPKVPESYTERSYCGVGAQRIG